jgi:hypothetical protein
MERFEEISLAMVALGFIVFTLGLFLSMGILNWIGGAMITIPVVVLLVKGYEERNSSLLDNMENKDRSVLPTYKANIRRKEILPAIMSLLLIIVVVAALGIMLKTFFFQLSDIDVDRAIKDGCAKVNMGGSCITAPSSIIIPYDVNNDGVKGGTGDTFLSLMESQNCSESCIMKRCGC